MDLEMFQEAGALFLLLPLTIMSASWQSFEPVKEANKQKYEVRIQQKSVSFFFETDDAFVSKL